MMMLNLMQFGGRGSGSGGGAGGGGGSGGSSSHSRRGNGGRGISSYAHDEVREEVHRVAHHAEGVGSVDAGLRLPDVAQGRRKVRDESDHAIEREHRDDRDQVPAFLLFAHFFLLLVKDGAYCSSSPRHLQELLRKGSGKCRQWF